MWILCTVLLVCWIVPWQFYLVSWFLTPFCLALYEQSTDSFLYSFHLRAILRCILLPLADFKIFGKYQDTPQIYAIHPHGLLALGQFFGFMLSEQRCIALVSEELLAIPVVAELLLLIGARPATRHTLETALKRGESVAVTPGGVVEMGLAQQDSAKNISIRKRQNFLTVAQALQRSIVPCLMLGEGTAYQVWSHPKLAAFQQQCYTALGWWGPIIAGGRWYTILPNAPLELHIMEPNQSVNFIDYAKSLEEEAAKFSVVLRFH